MGEGIYDQVDGIVERHHETGHIRVGDSDGLALNHLLYPERNDRTAAGHHIAIARAANGGPGIVAELTPLGIGHLFHQSLTHAHCIDGIGSLVGRKYYHIAHAMLDSGFQHIIRTENIGTNSLYREEFT